MTSVTHIAYPRDSEYDELSSRLLQLFEQLDSLDQLNPPVLYDLIEVEALESLIKRGEPNTHVQFEYCNHAVRVYGDERIEVRTIPDSD